MYVIARDDGQYVTNPGSEKSYTTRLENARVYRTREEATKDLCPGNEKVYAVSDILKAS
jgi:hypothetical protein